MVLVHLKNHDETVLSRFDLAKCWFIDPPWVSWDKAKLERLASSIVIAQTSETYGKAIRELANR